VTIADPQTDPPALALINAASMVTGPVAPGEIVSIFGVGIGPVDAKGAVLTASGFWLLKWLARRSFLTDAPHRSSMCRTARSTRKAPYEIAGKSAVEVEVFYQGTSRGKATVPVDAASPGIFTVLSERAGGRH